VTVAWETGPRTNSLGKEDMSIVRIKFSFTSTILSSSTEILNDSWSLPAVIVTGYGPEL